MRTVSSVLLVLALLNSLSHASYDHVHLDDPDHDHSHFHDGHETGLAGETELEWEAPEHDLDAVYKDWLASPAEDNPQLVADCAVAFADCAQLPCAGAVEALITRNHDPPDAFARPARAPPKLHPLPKRSA